MTRCISSAFIAVALIAVRPAPYSAQTFSQVIGLGSGIGARLTRSLAIAELESELFMQTAHSATLVFGNGSGTAYQFVPDRDWNRILFGEMDGEIQQLVSFAGSPGHFVAPGGVEISGSQKLLVADEGYERILLFDFDAADPSLTYVGEVEGNEIQSLSDVAWDGTGSPLSSTISFYTLTWLGRIAYWTWNGSSATLDWVYGASGGGVGAFQSASGICVGHTASSAKGNSLFTNDFYVADAGNQRIVWLQRNGSSVIWKKAVSLPEGWRPADCTVDHFGNVYVADRLNSQIVKYSWSLVQLDRYGSYGTGATNYNTFAHPHSVHVPFGIKTVAGQDVWYGEGRILTAEDWGPGSGGLEHWLGVAIPSAFAVSTLETYTQFVTTDVALLTVTLHQGTHQAFEPTYRTIWNNLLASAGWLTATWDGYDSDGLPAPVGFYHFDIHAVSGYGCSGGAWCEVDTYTTQVYFEGLPGTNCEVEICQPLPRNVALLLDDIVVEHVPTTYRLGQVLTAYTGPLFRVEGTGGGGAGAGGGAALSPGEAVASVRAQGIRALSVDVPREGAAVPVTVRIYGLSGRLVRVLVDEVLDPGSYVVGWDGADAAGTAVRPGVYIAVMTAGAFRGAQRLILK